MATVATMHECPACKEVGKLGALLTADVMAEKMYCENGHEFTIDEIESGIPAQTEIPAMVPPPPPPQIEAQIAAVESAAAPAAVEEPKYKLTFKEGGPEAEHVAAVVETPGIVSLPGGAVRAAIVIQEQDWMAIKAEAENQRQTPMKYLQEAVDRGMSYRWFF